MPTLNWSALYSYGLPLVVLMVFWWFFLIKPQTDQDKKRRKLMAEIKKGDRVVTAAGIIGTITDLKKDYVYLRIADKTEVQFLRSAVQDMYREKDKA